MKHKIKVLVADDHAIVRKGLSSLIAMESDLVVVGEAIDGEDAISKTLSLNPDVVIMDLMMPKMDGAVATAELHSKAPMTKVIILTTFGTSDGIAHALDSGACGALAKSSDNDELLTAIREVSAGKKYISPEIRHQLDSDPPVKRLTPRQQDILASLVRGLTNKDIARMFGIRPDSAGAHVNDILQKLGAANRSEAVAIALRKHLLKI